MSFDIYEKDFGDYRIWIGPRVAIDPNKDSIDVIVTMKDGSRYIPTFFTLQEIATIMEEKKRTGEDGAGKYFWAVDWVVIDQITHTNIEHVIAAMVKDGTLQRCAKRYQPQSKDEING